MVVVGAWVLVSPRQELVPVCPLDKQRVLIPERVLILGAETRVLQTS